MKKGPFSVDWLAQSSRGCTGESPAVLDGSRCAPRSPGPSGRGTVRGARGPRREGSSPQTSRSVPEEAPWDREAAERSSPGHEAEAAGGAVPGRARTKFSAAQLQELERSFREQRYIGAGEKRRLAAALNLSQSQIKTWFQNRRMKFKRQTQDARIEALFSGLFLPHHYYPDMATSSYSHGMCVNVSTSAVTLHPTVLNPVLLPSVLAQSHQPFLPNPSLQLPPSPGLSCYSSVIPAVTLTTEHKRLTSQSYFLPVKNVKHHV
ncbi:homeobox protein vex1-like [Pseudopipra pipra]|uniref:homeobox protein vex1-like n=1 Tax=Pseudopipra pipra TaxID=415032 RepID=UPI0031386801